MMIPSSSIRPSHMHADFLTFHDASGHPLGFVLLIAGHSITHRPISSHNSHRLLVFISLCLLRLWMFSTVVVASFC